MRRPRALGAVLLILLAAAPAGAQQVVTSARPEQVAVTVYRAPHRNADEALQPGWLNGYALISETRQVTIPAGESEIRFEGVAGGIIPQSAIVRGLPEGIVERNRDAWLLSPESLLDRSLGRRVHLRRTSNATGAVTEQDAIVRSGANGAVVLQTAAGFEALRCTGLPETLHYEGVPAGLSARPTLSVRARSREPVTATVRLAYLANGFDWQANYVANLSADGSHVELFAWLTLASSDETSFANASTQAVAGRLNREGVEIDAPEAAPINLTCWPQGRTDQIPDQSEITGVRAGLDAAGFVAEDALNELPQLRAADAQNVVVTAQRAVQENLGDLKLYRIPEPVTVAAHSQKQVAFLQQPNVEVSLVYRHRLDPDDTSRAYPAQRVLVTRNRTREGLGLPLPAGGVQVFAAGLGRPILLGEGALRDRAVGEDVEVEIGEAPGVRAEIRRDRERPRDNYVLTITNDQTLPVRYEIEFDPDEGDGFSANGARLGRRNGHPLWLVTVPANGSATLRYRLRKAES